MVTQNAQGGGFYGHQHMAPVQSAGAQRVIQLSQFNAISIPFLSPVTGQIRDFRGVHIFACEPDRVKMNTLIHSNASDQTVFSWGYIRAALAAGH